MAFQAPLFMSVAEGVFAKPQACVSQVNARLNEFIQFRHASQVRQDR